MTAAEKRGLVEKVGEIEGGQSWTWRAAYGEGGRLAEPRNTGENVEAGS